MQTEVQVTKDLLGKALYEYHKHPNKDGTATLLGNYGLEREWPLARYFGDDATQDPLETLAIKKSKGKILLCGATGGRMAVPMQRAGKKVYAMDSSPLCARVLALRGVRHCIMSDILKYRSSEKYDCIMLPSDNVGVVRKLDKMPELLVNLKRHLSRKGFVLLESREAAAIYRTPLPTSHYRGEVEYCLRWNGLQSIWYEWLHVDPETMEQLAIAHKWKFELLAKAEKGRYLCKLSLK